MGRLALQTFRKREDDTVTRTAVGGAWGDDEWQRKMEEALRPFREQSRALQPMFDRIQAANTEALQALMDQAQALAPFQEQMRAATDPAWREIAERAMPELRLGEAIAPFSEVARQVAKAWTPPPMPQVTSEFYERLRSIDWDVVESRLEESPDTVDLARSAIRWERLSTDEGLLALAVWVWSVAEIAAGWGDGVLADDLKLLASVLVSTAAVYFVIRPKPD